MFCSSSMGVAFVYGVASSLACLNRWARRATTAAADAHRLRPRSTRAPRGSASVPRFPVHHSWIHDGFLIEMPIPHFVGLTTSARKRTVQPLHEPRRGGFAMLRPRRSHAFAAAFQRFINRP